MKLIESVPIGALASIAFAGSFTHISDLAARSGQDGWMAYAIAVSVDLLAVVASLEMRRDKRLGRRPTVPVLVLALAVLTALAANLAEAQRTPWGFIVAGVPAGCFLLAVALIERRGGASEHRDEAVEPFEEPAQEGEPESAPEPKPRKQATPRQRKPVSVDELLARAREADAAHKEKAGKPITRDKLRTALGVSTGTASAVLKELKAAA